MANSNCTTLTRNTSKRLIDLTGQRFGRLIVIEYIGKRKWLCKCDCGKISTPTGFDLKRSRAKSCGCLRIEIPKITNAKHGCARVGGKTAEYRIWAQMNNRCYNPKTPRYGDYGGRGITVFEPWRTNFQEFYDYVGQRPSSRHSIDRINNDGNYEPGNVRWATRNTQANNTRSNRFLTFNQETLTMSEWGERMGISKANLWYRLNAGWCIGCTLTIPVSKIKNQFTAQTCIHKSSK